MGFSSFISMNTTLKAFHIFCVLTSVDSHLYFFLLISPSIKYQCRYLLMNLTPFFGMIPDHVFASLYDTSTFTFVHMLNFYFVWYVFNMHMCTCIYTETRTWHWCVPQCFSALLFEIASHLFQSSLSLLMWLASEPKVSYCLCPSNVKTTHKYRWSYHIFSWTLRIQTHDLVPV